MYLGSMNDEFETTKMLAEVNLDLATKVNGDDSVYILDSLLTKVSVLSDLDASDEEMLKVIA